jgi:hypothetical protein
LICSVHRDHLVIPPFVPLASKSSTAHKRREHLPLTCGKESFQTHLENPGVPSIKKASFYAIKETSQREATTHSSTFFWAAFDEYIRLRKASSQLSAYHRATVLRLQEICYPVHDPEDSRGRSTNPWWLRGRNNRLLVLPRPSSNIARWVHNFFFSYLFCALWKTSLASYRSTNC